MATITTEQRMMNNKVVNRDGRGRAVEFQADTVQVASSDETVVRVIRSEENADGSWGYDVEAVLAGEARIVFTADADAGEAVFPVTAEQTFTVTLDPRTAERVITVEDGAAEDKPV